MFATKWIPKPEEVLQPEDNKKTEIESQDESND